MYKLIMTILSFVTGLNNLFFEGLKIYWKYIKFIKNTFYTDFFRRKKMPQGMKVVCCTLILKKKMMEWKLGEV